MNTSGAWIALVEKFGTPSNDAYSKFRSSLSALVDDYSDVGSSGAGLGSNAERFGMRRSTQASAEKAEQMIVDFRRKNKNDRTVVGLYLLAKNAETAKAQCIATLEKLGVNDYAVEFFDAEKGVAVFLFDGELSVVIDSIDWGATTIANESDRTLNVRQE